VIIASGPLAGTQVSGTGTISAVFKGPMTNLAGATQANGYLGAFLRSQGFDALILQGRADRLTHLHIDEAGVALRSAEHLAGLGVWELEDRLRAEYGLSEKQLSVFGIGPAGENRVRFAALVGDRGHVAAHNGVGAVLGAKRLKAISVKRGKTKPFVADPKRLNELVTPLFVDARDFGGASIYNWGTAGGLSNAARGGWLPVKNYTTSVFPEHERVNGQYIRGHFKWKTNPCWACRMGCCKLMEVTEGPYAGYRGEEPEYEGMAAMGPQIGVAEAGAAVMLANEADSLGVDINELGWLIGWVMECYERGWLTRADLDGIEARFGDAEAALALLRKIAWREGCGDWLAEGVMRASQRVGGPAADAAIYTLKGNSPRTHDHRGRWAEMFDTCLSSTGTIEVSFGGLQTERLGLAPLKDRFSPTEIVDQMVNLNGWHQFDDCLGVCRFDFTNAQLGIATVNAVTGWDLTLADALQIGRRISAQLRVWSFLHGLDPALERPSTRYGSVPVDGPAAGADIRPHWDGMVRRFFERIGWSPEGGVPLPETLRALDLAELVPVAERLLAERARSQPLAR
jgi:aldehyde:ferredoxin oxidoreductase